MTPLQLTLAVVGYAIILGSAAILTYTIWSLVTGRATVSGYMRDAPRWVVALVGLGVGLVIGVMFAHWWFPTVG